MHLQSPAGLPSPFLGPLPRSIRIRAPLLPFLFALLSLAAASATADSRGIEAGSPLDVVPFGTTRVEAGGAAIEVRWAEPRKLRRVELEFPGGHSTAADSLKVEYWWKNWDGRAEPVAPEGGAGAAGWGKADDWSNGEWREAKVIPTETPSGLSLGFAPTAPPEFPKLTEPGVGWRRTLKLRISAAKSLPEGTVVRAFTDAVGKPLSVRIEFGEPAVSAFVPATSETIRLEAYNGAIGSATATGDLMPGAHEGEWTLPARGHGALRSTVMTAFDAASADADRTIVTVRAGARSFSFATDDVARGERILVDDFGIVVEGAETAIGLQRSRERRAETGAWSVYDRVSKEPEQTLANAWDAMPLKHPLNFVHGLPGNRNAMEQEAGGEIRIAAGGIWFDRMPSPADASKEWDDPKHFRLYFGLPDESHRSGRQLLDGYLPLLTTDWQDGPLHYRQQTILDTMDGDWSDFGVDTPSVLLMRIRIVNTSERNDADAHLLLSAHGRTVTEKLYHDGDRVLADYKGRPCLRYIINTRDQGSLKDGEDGVHWSLPMKPGQACDLDFFIPSITPTSPEQLAILRRHNFDTNSRRICETWRKLTSGGARIETPEPWINGFYRAHARHLLVNCFSDMYDDSLYAHVGTFSYGAYPNESVMMIADLDRRGFHDEARRCLDGFVRHQGSVKFLGDYTSTEGLLYGANGHEMGNYNKSHGYVLWGLAEHWKMTHDRAWLDRVAPAMIAACEWIIRERAATMHPDADGSKPIEYGFLPRGSLEDVTDFWYWQATNSATAWGFLAAADALSDAGRPEAARLRGEAAAYRDDVMRGLTEARIRAPVVPLRDGTYVPHFPSNLHTRGRSEGWVRETLEGPMFLLYYGLIAPDDPAARWILADYEDNLFISDKYGYAIPAFDRFWFSRGGFSMQANLLDCPPSYLDRDQVRHFLRAYFNAFASGFYPGTKMLVEHALPELGYIKGDHFKSSDEAQSNGWLRLMFIRENGDSLYLGQAIPRYWMKPGNHASIENAPTEFGPMSLHFTAGDGGDTITAELEPPRRNPPSRIYLRFRHPESRRIESVTVNGRTWSDYDPARDWVVLPGNLEGTRTIVATFSHKK